MSPIERLRLPEQLPDSGVLGITMEGNRPSRGECGTGNEASHRHRIQLGSHHQRYPSRYARRAGSPHLFTPGVLLSCSRTRGLVWRGFFYRHDSQSKKRQSAQGWNGRVLGLRSDQCTERLLDTRFSARRLRLSCGPGHEASLHLDRRSDLRRALLLLGESKRWQLCRYSPYSPNRNLAVRNHTTQWP